MIFHHYLQALMTPSAAMAPRMHSGTQSHSFQHITVGHLLGAITCAGCWESRGNKSWFLPPQSLESSEDRENNWNNELFHHTDGKWAESFSDCSICTCF